MKYKVGDKVRIKSLDWYNENKDINGNVHCGDKVFDNYMSVFCGSVVTIGGVYPYNAYDIQEDMHCRAWTDEMIEGLVEEETKPEPKFKIGEVVYVIDYDTDLKIQNRIYKNGMWNYIINIESAPFIFYDNELKKKKEYPKTYEECCKVLNVAVRDFDILYNMLDTTEIIYSNELDRLLNSFRKILICRDAYWKIAGDEMGLGKPWEPDWESLDTKYDIYNYRGVISHNSFTVVDRCVLVFPTEEMRDAFKENFKEEIEFCKEFL